MRHRLAIIPLILLATFVVAQTVGSPVQVGTKDEASFPTPGTAGSGALYRGALIFGTDAGALYMNNGSSWQAMTSSTATWVCNTNNASRVGSARMFCGFRAPRAGRMILDTWSSTLAGSGAGTFTVDLYNADAGGSSNGMTLTIDCSDTPGGAWPTIQDAGTAFGAGSWLMMRVTSDSCTSGVLPTGNLSAALIYN